MAQGCVDDQRQKRCIEQNQPEGESPLQADRRQGRSGNQWRRDSDWPEIAQLPPEPVIKQRHDEPPQRDEMQLLEADNHGCGRREHAKNRRSIENNLDQACDAKQDSGCTQRSELPPPGETDDEQKQHAKGSTTQDEVDKTGQGQFH